jgi:hemerythrin-like domain-containing protein
MSCCGPLAHNLPPMDLHQVSSISILGGEHEVIRQVLSCLVGIAKRGVKENRIPQPHADQALEILQLFADRCHHGKEEDILFPALEAKSPGFAPAAVMRGEHVEGRAHIAEMVAAASEQNPNRFFLAATAYVDLLRAHIDKENEILFRVAQSMLSEDDDAALLRAYRALEHDDMGNGTHERLLGLADGLAAAYDVPRASAQPHIMTLLTAVCGCRKPTATQTPPVWQQQAGALRYLAEKVGRVHGESHPQVAILAEVVASLADAGDDLATARALAPRLAELTDDFTPWQGSCASVWQLFTGLGELARELPGSTVEATD